MTQRKKAKISVNEEATSYAYFWGMGAFFLAYLVTEATQAARPHPIHWAVALSVAMIAGTAAYLFVLKRGCGRH